MLVCWGYIDRPTLARRNENIRLDLATADGVAVRRRYVLVRKLLLHGLVTNRAMQSSQPTAPCDDAPERQMRVVKLMLTLVFGAVIRRRYVLMRRSLLQNFAKDRAMHGVLRTASCDNTPRRHLI
jgi:hypothetical protein